MCFRLLQSLFVFHLKLRKNGSNTDGSFTVDDSNSFFSLYKILPIAQENKYLGIFSIILWNCMLCVLIRIASSIYNHCVETRKDFPKLSLFASCIGAMINPQWLELPMSRTNFLGPKDVRAIEVRLYIFSRVSRWIFLNMSCKTDCPLCKQ